MNTREQLDAIASERIIMLDGAMGSMIQSFKLTEKDFRGRRFAEHPAPLSGCNDLLCITSPWVVLGIHEAYLRSGADIIETCSFNATSISLADFGIGDLAYEISAAAAGLARKAADKFSTPDKPRFVAGSMGPTAKSAGIFPYIQEPAKRAVTWDELEAAYYDNARGLLDGGADILLIETVVDTLNAKAAIAAVKRILEERRGSVGNRDIPLMISASVSEGGRLLSGQTVEAFYISVSHANPWSIGLNCSFGAQRLKPYAADIAAFAPCLVSVHPNAGLPNESGEYSENPVFMADRLEEYMAEGIINIAGGCCGSTPAHIAVIAGRAKSHKPRKIPAKRMETKEAFLAGLEPLRESSFTIIGERTNTAGSRKFLRLLKEEKYNDALNIAREMINTGADVIDVCMDDALLDAEKTMKTFLALASQENDIARVPVMIDSSRWEVIEAALKCVPGKGLINSISLKEGEEEFLRRALLARRYGAAAVIMLFDEKGQAADYERKIAIARRSWDLLVNSGFPASDIVFDPNVLAIATGIPEHDGYALDFIRTCEWIREHCPGARISGGVSNLSFSFRGNDAVRTAMHAVFLKHAKAAGLNMAIVNPGSLPACDNLDPALREAAEDIILCRGKGEDPAGRLLALAEKMQDKPAAEKKSINEWRTLPPEERIVYAMINGSDTHIEEDVLELLPKYSRALEIVETVLMRGMKEVGDRFGEGKLFLPQVIRSARVMKKAVAALEPYLEAEKTGTEETGKSRLPGILLATVKGDVHDIGKNIVAVVLGCGGYDITDLGVMVPAEKIIEEAKKQNAGIVGLSGLITPSLNEMINTAREMEAHAMKIPLLIGGAATSLAHTSLRIAPVYSGPVVYVPDAGRSAEVVRSLFSATEKNRFLEKLEASYRNAVLQHEKIKNHIELLSVDDARKNKIPVVFDIPSEPKTGKILEFNDYSVERVIPYIDWSSFLQTWDLAEETYPSAYTVVARKKRQKAREKLMEEAGGLLKKIIREKILELRGTVGFFPALSDGDDIVIYETGMSEIARFCFPRNQEKKRAGGPNACLADFIMPGTGRLPDDRTGCDWIGFFALSAGFGLAESAEKYRKQNNDYCSILLASIANTLAEAFSEEVHLRVRREWWGYVPDETLSAEEIFRGAFAGIRPAFGYPACPDHWDKKTVFDLLDAEKRCGFKLTETAMIIPAASVCGMYFAVPGSYYFGVGRLDDDQLGDWAGRKGISPREAEKRLGRI
ncbi:MAG: methionine synthase [Treponema sp.]|jgi:5-methyltetrahydrofolate--homocysteine methyltransferase|nr:methionine synthase [Treponema sp.]